MGFFSGLASEGYDRQYTDRQLLARLMQYFRPYGVQLAAVTALVLTISLTGAAIPVIVARGVDYLSSQMTVERMVLLSG
ncbi:MAG: hypothetical protein JXB15_17495, partial [Anaerolineales bacterium]|nr:hypothetical protein [Anaerolineales bacterium]